MKKHNICIWAGVFALVACGGSDNDNEAKIQSIMEYTGMWEQVSTREIEEVGCEVEAKLTEIKNDKTKKSKQEYEPDVQCNVPSSLEIYPKRVTALRAYKNKIDELEPKSVGDISFNAILYASLSEATAYQIQAPISFVATLSTYDLILVEMRLLVGKYSETYNCDFSTKEEEAGVVFSCKTEALKEDNQVFIEELDKKFDDLLDKSFEMKKYLSEHEYYDPSHKNSIVTVGEMVTIVRESL